MPPLLKRIAPAALVCGCFVALGLPFIPYAGAHYDEVLFATAIYAPEHVEYAMKFGALRVPIMLMTYVGTLKALIFAPVFALSGTTHLTLRLPVLLMGGLSVGLFFLALRRITDTRVAMAGAALLATDAVYLLTSVFDWGPVALQHLLFTAAIYCAVRYAQEQGRAWLFLTGLCAGLALWDKALFIWLLAGMTIALAAVFPRELLAVARSRRTAAALLGGFLLGGAPFFYYNKLHPLRTFTSNTAIEEQQTAGKILALDRTMDGSGLFGYLVRESPEGAAGALSSWERASLWISARSGEPRRSLQHLLLAAGVLAAPLLLFGPWRRVALLFLLGGTASWGLMAMTRNAGGSLHHTILLWPIPQLLVSLALAELARRVPRRGFAVGVLVLAAGAASNLLVLNQYMAQFIAFGPSTVWTDAIHPLMLDVGSQPGRTVFAVDWGITQQVEFYGQGKVSFHRPGDAILVTLDDPKSQAYLEESLANDRNLFVTHPEGREVFAGVRGKLLEFAGARGYHDKIKSVINDRHGVPVFEIHEFRR